MKIILHVQRAETNDTPPSVIDEILTYRGLSYDLSSIEEGDLYEHCEPFVEAITRINGELVVKLQYHYSTDTAETNQPTDWSAYTFNVTAGQCPCPILRKPINNVELAEQSEEEA
ncbi:hypothetical protein [uncultured Rheinheimera sp.]|uniref:hypothetical protein n=1 Tax=uncultured Rheinheimera sp. TaxID=400532 RepID=UPI0025917EED|nr:hypothetical protein [uncultured Rheinheimera sp.]